MAANSHSLGEGNPSAASYSNKPMFTPCCALPTGIFYAQVGPSRTGLKSNVLFSDRKPAAEKPWTDKLWIYDLRTNKHFTLKENPRSPLLRSETCAIDLPGLAPDRRGAHYRIRKPAKTCSVE